MPPCHDSATATHGSGPGIPLKRDEEIFESVGTIISTVTEIRLMSLPGLSSFGQLDQHFRLVNLNKLELEGCTTRTFGYTQRPSNTTEVARNLS